MSNEELIPATDFCAHHCIDVSFLQSLQEYGLVELTTVKETAYLHPEQLETVEKFVRLHYDLALNFESLDVIHHILERMEAVQAEVNTLRNRLRFLEG